VTGEHAAANGRSVFNQDVPEREFFEENQQVAMQLDQPTSLPYLPGCN